MEQRGNMADAPPWRIVGAEIRYEFAHLNAIAVWLQVPVCPAAMASETWNTAQRLLLYTAEGHACILIVLWSQVMWDTCIPNW